MRASSKLYLVEFKVGEHWIETESFTNEETPQAIEEALHAAGVKARVIIKTISSEVHV